MAITNNARKEVLAHIVPHAASTVDMSKAKLTSEGLISFGRGTVMVAPATEQADLKTGPLAQLTEDERRAIGLDRAAVAEPVKAETRKRTRKARSPRPSDSAPQAVKVNLLVPNVGVLPSQYAHCYEGKGVLVLGLTDMSYIPSMASRGPDGTMQGALELESRPGQQYVFAGNEFKDNDGIRNIILIAVPRSTDNDGKTQ